MGGAYERLTLYTPLISPLNPPPHTLCVGGRGDRMGTYQKQAFGSVGWVPIKNKKKQTNKQTKKKQKTISFLAS